MMCEYKLYDIAFIVKDKINSNEIKLDQYVDTDSMLQNKHGKKEPVNLPKNTNLIKFKKHDILISNIRPYLKKIWLASFDGGCSQDILVIRAKEKKYQYYLFALLLQDNFYDYSMLATKGIKMPRGIIAHILNYPINILSDNDKQSIGNFIINIEKYIILNKKINIELEKMIKTLYTYWFVQFEFPDENGKPYKSSGGKMIWNEELQKKIPEGWKIIKLKNLVTINNEKEEPNEKHNLIELAVMPTNSICLFYFSKGDKLSTNVFKMKKYDILFGSIRPYLLKSGFAPLDGLVAGTIHSVSPKNNNYYNFILLTFCNNEIFNYATQKSKGARTPVIGIDDLLDYKVPYSPEIITKFNKILNFKEIISNNIIENQELISLRDFLLPLLMNGQAVISD